MDENDDDDGYLHDLPIPATREREHEEVDAAAREQRFRVDSRYFDESCSVCLEPITADEDAVVVRGCMHYFHRQCATQCMERCNHTCPMCRGPMPASALRELHIYESDATASNGQREMQQCGTCRTNPACPQCHTCTGCDVSSVAAPCRSCAAPYHFRCALQCVPTARVCRGHETPLPAEDMQCVECEPLPAESTTFNCVLCERDLPWALHVRVADCKPHVHVNASGVEEPTNPTCARCALQHYSERDAPCMVCDEPAFVLD